MASKLEEYLNLFPNEIAIAQNITAHAFTVIY